VRAEGDKLETIERELVAAASEIVSLKSRVDAVTSVTA
jgi:hypothetical protein